MPRVLLIAEAANPQWTSVPLVGWSQAAALRQIMDVHLVTQVRNRQAILDAGWREGVDFTAIDSEAVAGRLHKVSTLLRRGGKGGWTIATALSSLGYYYFEHRVWQQFGARLRSGEFDLVHRLTPLSPTAASPLAKKLAKINVPFILGPLNGGLPWPWQFNGARRAEAEWLSYIRNGYRLLPGYRSTRKHAAAILVGSRATQSQVPGRFQHKCVYMPENGVDPSRFDFQRTHVARQPIHIVFLGRLVPYKGPDMLLEAAGDLVKRGLAKLTFIGDGPMMATLRQRAAEQSLGEAVRFTGWIEHAQVQRILSEADVLGFPSIREFGGAVVLEAMAMGVMPVVVDYGGPGELVTPDTGVLLKLTDRAGIVAQLKEALEKLAHSPGLIEARAQRGIAYVRERFTWDAKARQVMRVYEQVVEKEVVPAEPALASGPGREMADV